MNSNQKLKIKECGNRVEESSSSSSHRHLLLIFTVVFIGGHLCVHVFLYLLFGGFLHLVSLVAIYVHTAIVRCIRWIGVLSMSLCHST